MHKIILSIKDFGNGMVPVDAVTSDFVPEQTDEMIRRCLKEFTLAYHAHMVATQPNYEIGPQLTP